MKIIIWFSSILFFSVSCFSQQKIATQEGSSNPALDPLNSTIVYFGDSQTRMGFFSDSTILTSGVSRNFTNTGYTTLTNILAGSSYFLPIDGNQGVNGNTTTQMVARLPAAIALAPKVAIVIAGTNDLPRDETASAIEDRLATIYNAFLNAGARVIAGTILPRFSGSGLELTAQQEAVRIEVNTWIKSLSNVNVVDLEYDLGSSSYFSEGLHPNAIGAYRIGFKFSEVLRSFVSSGNITDSASALYTTNPAMGGTNGSLNTATGAVSTGWTLLSNNAGGATVVGSKSNDDKQIITISGTYTGDGKMVELRDIMAASGRIGDVFESFLDIEILSAPTNIATIDIISAGFNSDYSLFTMAGQAFYESEHSALQLPVGRYQFRSPPQTLTDNVDNFATLIRTTFLDGGSATTVSGSFKIWKAGVHKVYVGPDLSGAPLVTGFTPGRLRNDYSGKLGCQITVGSSPVTVTELGRWIIEGNSETHTLSILASDGTTVIASVLLNTSDKPANAFAYSAITPVVLSAGTTYYLVSDETTGGDQWYDAGAVSTNTGISVGEAVYKAVYEGAEMNRLDIGTGFTYVPVTLRFTYEASNIINLISSIAL